MSELPSFEGENDFGLDFLLHDDDDAVKDGGSASSPSTRASASAQKMAAGGTFTGSGEEAPTVTAGGDTVPLNFDDFSADMFVDMAGFFTSALEGLGCTDPSATEATPEVKANRTKEGKASVNASLTLDTNELPDGSGTHAVGTPPAPTQARGKPLSSPEDVPTVASSTDTTDTQNHHHDDGRHKLFVDAAATPAQSPMRDTTSGDVQASVDSTKEAAPLTSQPAAATCHATDGDPVSQQANKHPSLPASPTEERKAASLSQHSTTTAASAAGLAQPKPRADAVDAAVPPPPPPQSPAQAKAKGAAPAADATVQQARELLRTSTAALAARKAEREKSSTLAAGTPTTASTTGNGKGVAVGADSSRPHRKRDRGAGASADTLFTVQCAYLQRRAEAAREESLQQTAMLQKRATEALLLMAPHTGIASLLAWRGDVGAADKGAETDYSQTPLVHLLPMLCDMVEGLLAEG